MFFKLWIFQWDNVVVLWKNIGVYLAPSKAIDYDIWKQSRNLELSFGSLTPQTGVTFLEFLETTLSSIIKNSNVIKYETTYPELNDVYSKYLSTVPNPYDLIKINMIIVNNRYSILDQL